MKNNILCKMLKLIFFICRSNRRIYQPLSRLVESWEIIPHLCVHLNYNIIQQRKSNKNLAFIQERDIFASSNATFCKYIQMTVSEIAPVINDNQKILRSIDPLLVASRIRNASSSSSSSSSSLQRESEASAFSISPIGSVVQSNSTPPPLLVRR